MFYEKLCEEYYENHSGEFEYFCINDHLQDLFFPFAFFSKLGLRSSIFLLSGFFLTT